MDIYDSPLAPRQAGGARPCGNGAKSSVFPSSPYASFEHHDACHGDVIAQMLAGTSVAPLERVEVFEQASLLEAL